MIFLYSLTLLFFIGFCYPQHHLLLDVIIETVLSIMLYIFFFNIVLGSFKLHLEKNKELLIESNEQISYCWEERKKSAAKYFLKMELFPYRFFKRCVESKKIQSIEEANSYLNFLCFVIVLLCSVVPLCYLIEYIYEEMGLEQPIILILMKILKFITLCFSMYVLINFCHNVNNSLPDYQILAKFFSIKIIVFLFVIQTIIINSIELEQKDCSNRKHLKSLYIFFVLGIENTLLSYFFLRTFGYRSWMMNNYH